MVSFNVPLVTLFQPPAIPLYSKGVILSASDSSQAPLKRIISNSGNITSPISAPALILIVGTLYSLFDTNKSFGVWNCKYPIKVFTTRSWLSPIKS